MSRFTDFVNNIQEKISQLTTLEIKTIVGDFVIDEKDNVLPKTDSQYRLMHSKIDLIGGDMTTHISKGIMHDEFSWVRDFHSEKEKRAHEIVQGNLKAVISLYELYQKTKGVKVENQAASTIQLTPTDSNSSPVIEASPVTEQLPENTEFTSVS